MISDCALVAGAHAAAHLRTWYSAAVSIGVRFGGARPAPAASEKGR